MKKHALFIFLIALAGVLSYANSLRNEFVFDDRALVVNNEYIRDAKYAPEIFSSDIHRKETNSKGTFYRPVQNLSFMLDYALWKLNPLGFHLTNLVLHVVNAVLVYLLLSALFKNGASFIAALLFAVHPVHTQAVSYISGRADLLMAFFFLLSCIAFMRSSVIISLILYGFALLSKENAIILPAALILFAKPKHFWPFLLMTFGYVALRLFALGYSSVTAMQHGLFVRLLGFAAAIPVYLKILFFPFGLHMERVFSPPAALSDPRASLSIFFLIALLIAAASLRKSKKEISFGIFWFFIMLLPVSNIVPLNAFLAEHWMYLPSIGVFLIIAYIFPFKKASFVLLGIIVISLGLATFKQNTYWADNLSLFERALRFSPQNYRLRNNLGIVYMEKGRMREAVFQFQEALRIKPDYKNAKDNLANARPMLNRLQKK